MRKAEKAHGLQRRIEGPDVAGRRVLAVEDTSTTGGSVLTAVEALREAGAEVVGVAVIVERGAAPAVEAAACPTSRRTRSATSGWADRATPSRLSVRAPERVLVTRSEHRNLAHAWSITHPARHIRGDCRGWG